jgi:hypothetical protein
VRTVDRPGEGSGEHRLAGARVVLEQEVAFTDQAAERHPDDVLLAQHGGADVGHDLRERVGVPLRLRRRERCRRRSVRSHEPQADGVVSLLERRRL